MKSRNIGIIIGREYLNRVKKKSFLVTNFLVPILFAGGLIALMVVMMNTRDKVKNIGVVDRSGIVMPMLENSETIRYVDYGACQPDSVKARMDEWKLDAVLSVSELDEAEKNLSAEITSRKPLGLETSEIIQSRINDALEHYRVASYGIADLERILQDVKADVRLKAYTMDDEGKETLSETGVYAVLSMGLGIFVFMFITLFGSMVMSEVIEEKSSRVVEVLVSSVKATELMFGKIIGIALVAITQFAIWILLTVVLVGAGSRLFAPDMLAESARSAAVTPGMDAMQLAEMPEPGELSVILGTLHNLPLGEMVAVFLVFFFFGYMLYASLFAAVGSAVENEGDTQQLQIPLTIPLMVAYIIALYAFKAPDSAVAFWGSMFPFTSPIVMIARLPFGVPAWELLLSTGLLIGTFVLFAWLSAKIYKVGILMFGKKSTWSDLWKWLKQK